MRNTYAGVCYRCGNMVGAGKGHFEKVSLRHRERFGAVLDGREWLVQHTECAIKHRGTAHTSIKNTIAHEFSPIEI